jgi:cation:H+ antiporter
LDILPLIALAAGLAALVWSAGWFVSGASGLARHLGMSPLLVGMLVVGFGTSAPEILISVTASLAGNAGLALGNAYGSNIANIGLILGLTALMSPVAVRARVVRRELPVLVALTLLTVALAFDLRLTRLDAGLLIVIFAGLVAWSVVGARRRFSGRPEAGGAGTMPLWRALLLTVAGLAVLIASSRLMIWGAVETAEALGVSDLVIGLTIVAVGTSLPELASTISAVRQRAHDIALGNVIGSNLFNTLAVVGVAGLIRPIDVPPELLHRDLPVMAAFTLAMVGVAMGVRRHLPGRVTRVEGGALLAAFALYTGYLAVSAAAD